MSLDGYERKYLDLRHQNLQSEISNLREEVKKLAESTSELKNQLQYAENHVRALEAFVSSKFPDEMNGLFCAIYWQQKQKDLELAEQYRQRAIDNLQQNGYTITKNGGC